jgi:hypothetical protein
VNSAVVSKDVPDRFVEDSADAMLSVSDDLARAIEECASDCFWED